MLILCLYLLSFIALNAQNSKVEFVQDAKKTRLKTLWYLKFLFVSKVAFCSIAKFESFCLKYVCLDPVWKCNFSTKRAKEKTSRGSRAYEKDCIPLVLVQLRSYSLLLCQCYMIWVIIFLLRRGPWSHVLSHVNLHKYTKWQKCYMEIVSKRHNLCFRIAPIIVFCSHNPNLLSTHQDCYAT